MVAGKIKTALWAKGAGRCYFCNQPLIGDYVSGNEDATFGFVAHIVAEEPGGPRGDATRSPLLANDIRNLMLMCYTHHKLIDVSQVDNYAEDRLQEMKAAHERRIEILTDVLPDRASHVLRYAAKIGQHDSPVSYDRVKLAMLPRRYPANGQSIGIEIKGNIVTDGEDAFWKNEPDNLQRLFERQVRDQISAQEIFHLSVFALAPMPLLIKLGSLLGDIVPADIYQLHREPSGWGWAENGSHIEYEVFKPAQTNARIALKLGISATISDDRITSVLGENVSIWSLNAKVPGIDVMRHADDLVRFRQLMRDLYNEIKSVHGQDTIINVFPAVPVSIAIELGRIRMPKADLPLLIYDQQPGAGFQPKLEIK